MNLSEFKAWFTGFTEFMPGAPTEKQWDRIKERVGEIDGKPITQIVYVDRYIERYPYRPYWSSGSSLSASDITLCSSDLPQNATAQALCDEMVSNLTAEAEARKAYASAAAFGVGAMTSTWDGETAMLKLGAVEFKEMMQ